jgi:hypothetical protein
VTAATVAATAARATAVVATTARATEAATSEREMCPWAISKYFGD